MKIPLPFDDATKLLNDENLHLKLSARLIQLAFCDNSAVSLRAIVELIEKPRPAITNPMTELTDHDFDLIREYLKGLDDV